MESLGGSTKRNSQMKKAIAALDASNRALADDQSCLLEMQQPGLFPRRLNRVNARRGLTALDDLAQIRERFEKAVRVCVDIVCRSANPYPPRRLGSGWRRACPASKTGEKSENAIPANRSAMARKPATSAEFRTYFQNAFSIRRASARGASAE